MPDWLVEILKQFPIVVVIGFVGWYCYRKVERAADHFLEREDRTRAEAATQVAEANRELIASKDDLIRRLDEALKSELHRLTKAVNELNKRLGG
jgi:hypothetical protein